MRLVQKVTSSITSWPEMHLNLILDTFIKTYLKSQKLTDLKVAFKFFFTGCINFKVLDLILGLSENE